jgi:hypothetical protein
MSSSTPATWTWDPTRKDHFYYSPEEDAWVYQSGLRVKQTAQVAKTEEYAIVLPSSWNGLLNFISLATLVLEQVLMRSYSSGPMTTILLAIEPRAALRNTPRGSEVLPNNWVH